MINKLLTTAFLIAICSVITAQNENYINDVYYDRFFRKAIIDVPKGKNNLPDFADEHGQVDKTALEGFYSGKNQYIGFGVIIERPWKNHVSWAFGGMMYKSPYAYFIDTANWGMVASGGLSIYTKYLKLYTGAAARYGSNPQLVTKPDTSYWAQAASASITPYLYVDFPVRKFLMSLSAIPTRDFKALARAGIILGLNYLHLSTDAYADRMKTPYGYDYDGGYSLAYIFEDPMGGNSKAYYARAKIGQSFGVNDSLPNMSFNKQIKNYGNAYAQIEAAYWWVLGFNYHKTEGFGWRIGIDYQMDRIKIVFGYSNKYVMPTSFGNNPSKNFWYMSIRLSEFYN